MQNMALSGAKKSIAELKHISDDIRRETLLMVHKAKSGHLGSAFSIVELLTTLYFHHLNIDPKNPTWSERDRFILSKGHGCSSLYVTLAKCGFFPMSELTTFIKDESRLPGHPSSMLLPGIEASTGSLGHGLSIGVGIALGAKRDKKNFRTVVIVSDGECDEGSTWEAILAAANWKLGNLTCIVDYNKIQSFGRIDEIMPLEPFAEKWRAFNWNVAEVDGHHHTEIIQALENAKKEKDRPSVIIAHTVKGKGVSFMENTVDWHYWTPTDAHRDQALAELP